MNHSFFSPRHLGRRAAGLACLLGCTAPALAHHPLGGRGPQNLAEGLLSGLGHPIIGIDHLAFMVAIGLLAVGQSRRYVVPAAFVLTTLVGTLLHVMRFDLVAVELTVALSVVVAGGLLFSNRRYRPAYLMLLCAVAGLFHGYAYGESIVGAEATPLLAYLAGFSIVQYALMATVIWVGGRVLGAPDRVAGGALSRRAGSVISLTGLVFLSLAIVAA